MQSVPNLNRIEKFVPILVKNDDSDPSCRIVSGCATDPTIDHDMQTCDAKWLQKAMGDYEKFGNIREMHQAIAAGVAISIVPDNDAYYVTSRIVDPGTVKKLDHGVLKGYSIGIAHPVVVRDNKAVGGRIVGGDIIEISLVDRPCNPAAMLNSVEVDKIEKVILGQRDEVEINHDFNELVAKLAELHPDLAKGTINTAEVDVMELLKLNELDDAKLALLTANMVRYLMLRELHEQAEPGEPMSQTMGTLSYVYDCMLAISKSESEEAWQYLAQGLVAQLVTSHTLDQTMEVIMAEGEVKTDDAELTKVDSDETTKLEITEEGKALLAEVEKMLTRADHAVLNKAHDMIAEMCKGEYCKSYSLKAEEADLTKSDDTETTETKETVTTETESTESTTEDVIRAFLKEQNSGLMEQLEAVQKKLAEVEDKVKVLGDEPDDTNAPLFQALQKGFVESQREPRLTELEAKAGRLLAQSNDHPDGLVRIRAMTELRKVRAEIKEIKNV